MFNRQTPSFESLVQLTGKPLLTPTMCSYSLTGFVAAVLAFSLASPAVAWNGEAHQLVAWVAEARLTVEAKAGVKELLGDAELSDAEVVSWADQVRRERRETAPWHYINIPVASDGYDAKRDSKDGNTVIGAVEKFAKVLANKQAPKEDRVEALKFLVHFVGDLHQPLHCVDRNGDKGGNRRLVFFGERKKAVSLHSVWDTLILPRSKGKQSVAEYGTLLNARITVKQLKSWPKGTPAEWAVESWKLAKECVYTADVPVDGDPPKLTEEYLAKAQPVVDEQIQKAGVRLAAVLNAALR